MEDVAAMLVLLGRVTAGRSSLNSYFSRRMVALPCVPFLKPAVNKLLTLTNDSKGFLRFSRSFIPGSELPPLPWLPLTRSFFRFDKVLAKCALYESGI